MSESETVDRKPPGEIASVLISSKINMYHNKYHAGDYHSCQACSDVWHWETNKEIMA